MSDKKSDTPYYIGLGIIIVIFGYFAVNNVIHYINKNKVVDSNRSQDRAPVADKFLKKFNQVPAFRFVNQQGDTITNETMKGKVYIVDFFFTTCPTICTPMTRNLAQVYDRLKDHKDFAILSVSIDPDYDTQEVLASYAAGYKASAPGWNFVRGNKEQTYELAQKGFNAYVSPSENEAIRFEHSGNFALVDRDGYIRSRKVKIDDNNENWIYHYAGVSENGMPAQVKEITEDAQILLNK